MKKRVAVIVPGLGERPIPTIFTRHWYSYGVEPVHFNAKWYSSKHFAEINKRLDELIDIHRARGAEVSLVGCSAGGSAVLNLWMEQSDKVHKVVSICGWLTVGSYRVTLENLRKRSNAFVESVFTCDLKLSHLNGNSRSRILTMRAFCDGVVPRSVSFIGGIPEVILPIPGHAFGIGAALALYARTITDFLTDS